VIKNYHGQPKNELLLLIRKMFPLQSHDKRAEEAAQGAIGHLKKLQTLFKDSRFKPDPKQKLCLKKQLRELLDLL